MKEFEGLPLFAKVVELNSFSEAARQLNMPSTSLSRKIQQLEAELGGKLLHRSTRSLSLTELGESVLPKATLIRDTLKELQVEAENFSTQPVGKLHISAPRAFCQDLLAPMIAKFRQQYPKIKIDLDTANRVQDLTKSSIDFAFRIGELADSSLIAHPLAEVDYELVASSEWVAQHGEISHPQALINYSTLRSHVEGYILPWQFSKDSESYIHQAESDLLSDDLYVLVSYVRAGIGLAYLPIFLTQAFINKKELIPLLPAWNKPSSTVYIIYPNRTYLPQKSKLFLKFIKDNREYFREKLGAFNLNIR